jgi:hypothetical protein
MAAATIPDIEPSEIYAGDSVTWKISGGDYPATSGWTLKYALVMAGKLITVTSAASGADHLVTITAATSAAYPTGEYSWRSYVEGGTSERYQINTGVMFVRENYALAADGYDARSWAKQTLDAIRARLKGDASTAQMNRRVGDLSVGEIPLPDLLRLEGELAQRVAAENAAADLAQGRRTKANKIKTRFI